MRGRAKARRWLAVAGAVAAVWAGVPRAGVAATLDWDITPGTVGAGDSAITGGTGTWNTTAGTFTADGGATNVAWVNANNDVARFGAPGGTVTLGVAVTANGLTFNTTGYTVTASTLTLAGTTPTFTVTNAADSATVASVIAGTAGFTVAGAGKLIDNTASTFTGNIALTGGVLETNMAGGAATSPLGNQIGTAYRQLTFTNNATLRTTATWNDNVPSTTNVGIVFNFAGAGTLDVSTGTLTLDDGTGAGTASTNAQLQGAGDLTKIGVGILSLGNGTSNFAWFTGQIFVNAGTLNLGALTTGSNPLGTTTAGTTVAAGAVLNVNATNVGAEPITVSGTGLASAPAGALIGNGGTATGPVTLAADASLGGPGNLTLSGVVGDGAGTFNVTKVGAGTLILTGANAWDGATTTVAGGAIRAVFGTGLPATTNLLLNGGAFEPTANFAGALGTGAGQVQLPGGASGFSAGAAAVSVSLNGGATLQWGTTPNFNPSSLVLNQTGAAGALTFQNPIDLNGATRTIAVNAPAGANTATVTGAITNGAGSAGLTKSGAGVLVLANAGNNWDGTTTVAGGVLRATDGSTLPAAPNLTLNGGVFETGVNFTRALGAGAGQVQLPGGASGFSANGGAVAVDLGGNGTGTGPQVVWGSATFNPTTLVLNEASANNALTFLNAIDLNNTATAATRTINVNANTATITGALTQSGGGATGLTTGGAGTLVLTAASTYAGATTINAGTLRLSGGTNRLPAATPVTMNGGTLDVGATSQTIASLAFPAQANATATISGAGGSLTVNGATDLQVGPGGTLATNFATTLNLAGLSNFTYNAPANTFRVGLASGAGNTVALGQVGTATLGTTNTITAASLALADVSANNDGGAATLNLGQTNALNVGGINLGFNGRSDATLQFAAGLTNPTVTIRGTAGGMSAAATFNIGNVATFAGAAQTAFTATANLSAGTVDANVTSMTVGSANAGTSTGRAGSQTSTFTMGAGTMNVGTLNVGRISSAAAGSITANFAAAGTFTMNNAGGTLNVTTVNLAENSFLGTFTTFTKTVSGTFNLTNGTVKATTIQRGVQTGSAATVTVAFNWTNGTVQNTDAADLTIAGVPITLASGTHTFNATGSQTITVDAASPVGGAGFTVAKAGTGTLLLAAANTYTGATTVNNGRVLVNGSIAGPATVNGAAGGGTNGATLGGSGTIAGNVTVNSGGVLAPGNSPGVLTISGAGASLTLAAGSTYAVELGGGTPGNGPSNYDQTNLTDAGSTATVTGSTLRVALQYAPAPGDTFTILTAGTVTGPFANGPITAGNVGTFTDSVNNTSGTITYNPGSIVLSNVVVPEPAAAGLLAVGAAGLLARRRRTRGARTA